jgi:hypothetical protein
MKSIGHMQQLSMTMQHQDHALDDHQDNQGFSDVVLLSDSNMAYCWY